MTTQHRLWASLFAWIPFSQTVCTTIGMATRQLILGQLPPLRHGSLTIHELGASKLVLGGQPITRETASSFASSAKTARPSENPQRPARALDVELYIHSPSAWTRILFSNDIGFAESYMLGEISCNDLPSFFRLMIFNSTTLTPSSNIFSKLANMVTSPLYCLSNTPSQALLNAQRHYSLSNDLFAAFLDTTMTYSAPIWLPLSDPASANDTLESAQLRKLQYTITAARIQASDHVLEIGTGWGSFAIEAVARTGCRVTTITASSEQALLARERIREAGFESSIKVLVCDYRQVPIPPGGRYDKVVSIEMIEHVGAAYLDTYFGCVERYLKIDGGIAVFQVITMPEGRYEGYKSRRDFIQRYIFPGGHLPTVSGLVASINGASNGRLVVEDVKSVSGHYVRALREWRKRFQDISDEALEKALKGTKSEMGKLEIGIFRRKWEYYFCYCEAGFATKTLGDMSITVGREGAMGLLDDIPM